MRQLLKYLPPIHELQKHEKFSMLIDQYGIDHTNMTAILTNELNDIRQMLLQNQWSGIEPGSELFITDIFNRSEKVIQQQFQYTLKNVINATGTILHTNLGRARLSEQTVEHVAKVASQYSNLEYKLEEGERGSRHSHVEELIKRITGAEAAMVVNNNAAAVYFILRTFALDKEVIVSRGQLVEIGGSFRISSIMEESGAKLIEVGTTNKTHLYDYERAINEETRMILKVHTSNFKVFGFTESVETEELVDLTNQHDEVIFYEDLGSGVLYDFRQHGIGEEPVVGEVLQMGADLVSFSGDKLLGGPQAGIIAGNKDLIDKLKKHQLARVLRVDKMTLAALEGTLMHYLKGKDELKKVPVIGDLLKGKEELKLRSERFKDKLNKVCDSYEVNIMEGTSQVGGGTMPEVLLPSFVVVLKHNVRSAENLAKTLRVDCTPGIIVRIQKNEILLDLRTVNIDEEEVIIEALASIK
ncbi:L-seryl-tRNA(Sec) selenium transferase [Niallia sp. XMNu-256]|uniref:L-seryl-tRNA(Sec) selenium transferase n=1 Tax=Niallia sp. XMNu-256 TaxID=3082444 RepID=UPI0030CAA9C8